MDQPVEDTQTQPKVTAADNGEAAASGATRTLPGKKRGRSRTRIIRDIAIIAAILAAIAGMTGFILQRLDIKRDVAAATKVTDQIINDIDKHDGGHAYSLGSAKFQKETSRADLIKQFAAVDMVTEGNPIIDARALIHKNNEKIAFITYKYPPKLANQSFYILVGVTEQSDGSWKLTDISGSADKSQLLVK